MWTKKPEKTELEELFFFGSYQEISLSFVKVSKEAGRTRKSWLLPLFRADFVGTVFVVILAPKKSDWIFFFKFLKFLWGQVLKWERFCLFDLTKPPKTLFYCELFLKKMVFLRKELDSRIIMA